VSTYKDYLDGVSQEDRALLVRPAGQRKAENVRRRELGLPLLTTPSILTEADNPLVEAVCCGRSTSADMLVETSPGVFACDMCR